MRLWHGYLLFESGAPRLYQGDVSDFQTQRERKTFYVGIIYDSLVLLLFVSIGIFDLVSFSGKGLCVIGLSHVFLVEPLYYFVHRLYHTPIGLKYVHREHHVSILTQPETAVSFFLPERLLYTLIFTPPLLIANALGYLSLASIVGYILLIDILNIWGHFNVSTLPKWWSRSFLRYLIYSPQYHGVHHRRPKKNIALFMPIWDVVFGTVDWKLQNR